MLTGATTTGFVTPSNGYYGEYYLEVQVDEIKVNGKYYLSRSRRESVNHDNAEASIIVTPKRVYRNNADV